MAVGAFSVQVSGEYHRVLRVFKRIQTQNRHAMRQGLADVSMNAKNFLVANYKGRLPLVKLSDGTLAKRRKGKLGSGARSPIPPYPGSRPLIRSGAMVRAIQRRPTGRLAFKIGVQPVFGPSAGAPRLPLSTLAAMHETGYNHTVEMTRRMWTYLMLLYGTITHPWQSRLFRFRPRTLVINVPPRPVWGPTWDNDVEPRAVDWMIKSWATHLGLQGRWA
jgi:hypothetical protein